MQRKKLNFYAPFSLEAANFLNNIKSDAFKIASMDNLNKLLIKKCLTFKKKILSQLV